MGEIRDLPCRYCYRSRGSLVVLRCPQQDHCCSINSSAQERILDIHTSRSHLQEPCLCRVSTKFAVDDLALLTDIVIKANKLACEFYIF